MFVVRVDRDKRDAIQRRVEPLGVLEDLAGSSDLAVLRVKDESSDPRVTWKKTQELLGSGSFVQPVLLDPDGRPQFPTGEISVRFNRKMSDRDLERFGTGHGLRFARRNEYVPEQAVFTLEGHRYIPAILEELSATGETRAAWANTVAHFDRK